MILITGASGFVGKNLLKNLVNRNMKVRALVRDKNKIDDSNKCEILEGDLLDKRSLDKATQNVDIVVHLAAIIKSSNTKELMNVNVQGTKNLVVFCNKNKVKKIIYVSSLDAGLSNTSVYGRSKRLGEAIIEDSGIDYIILRPSLIYGKNSKDIIMLSELIRKLPLVPVIGNGKSKIQPVYVEDVSGVIIKLIYSKIKNKMYYIAGEEMISMNDLINEIADLYSKRVIKIHIPLWALWLPIKLYSFVFKSSSINYDSLKLLNKDKICDISDIKKDLKFKPISFDDGLKWVI